MIHFSPSILSADFMNLQADIEEVTKAGADYLHIDIMDGMFVPSISIGMPVLKCIRNKSDLFLDVHLMVEDPERYINDFADSGADLISIHFEATKNIDNAIKLIKNRNIKVGLAINPETDVNNLKPYLDKIDMALVMTVHPGFAGQKYIPECTDKIIKLANWIREEKLNCDLEVDGGINLNNVKSILDDGANVIVAGSAVFKGDIKRNTEDFLKIIRG